LNGCWGPNCLIGVFPTAAGRAYLERVERGLTWLKQLEREKLTPPEHVIECSSLVAIRSLLQDTDRAALLPARQVEMDVKAGDADPSGGHHSRHWHHHAPRLETHRCAGEIYRIASRFLEPTRLTTALFASKLPMHSLISRSNSK